MNGDSPVFTVNQTPKKDTNHGISLRNLKSRSTSPWLCVGDFNEITRQSEKIGGRTRPHSQMQLFRDALDDCSFIDLGYVGFPYTWHKHFADYTIFERLDRGLATAKWFTRFPGTKIHHLDVTTSDHKPRSESVV